MICKKTYKVKKGSAICVSANNAALFFLGSNCLLAENRKMQYTSIK